MQFPQRFGDAIKFLLIIALFTQNAYAMTNKTTGILIFILLFTFNLFAQKKGSGAAKTHTLQTKAPKSSSTTGATPEDKDKLTAAVNSLLQNLQSNPSNPLNVDKTMLLDIANKIPDGNLKSKLLEYSLNFGVDRDLSMRQVYWDLGKAFNVHSSLNSISKYSQTSKGLNILLNNPEQLFSSLKNNLVNYKPGAFLNDPYFISSLTSVTGSQAMAQGIGAGVELAAMYLAERKELKAFKENYPKMVEMSSLMIYPEVDNNLSKSLIDACVVKHPFNMITPVYRYDFKNGASLRSENGVLYFINNARQIKKAITEIEPRNDGSFEKKTIKGGSGFSSRLSPNVIRFSTDETYFYLQTGKKEKQSTCIGCLMPGDDFIIDAETGEARTIKRLYNFVGYDNIHNVTFTKDTAQIFYFAMPLSGMYKVNITDGKFMEALNIKMDKDKKMLINNKSRKYADFMGAYNGMTMSHRQSYNFNRGTGAISLIWGAGLSPTPLFSSEVDSTIYTSTVLQANSYIKGQSGKGRFESPDGMINELTGLVINKSGSLFFTTAKGTIGMISNENWDFDDPMLADKIRKAGGSPLLSTYNFIVPNTKYLFNGTSAFYYAMPALTLTPDEDYLTYILQDNLYIIDAKNLNNVKKLKLAITPFNHFYGKENGELTLYIQAFNEFKLPVTKKYSLTKLVNTFAVPIFK